MTLSLDDIRKITAYLDASTPLPAQAGLIFLPGTLFQTPALIAAELFKQGVAPYIVVTGGDNRFTGENEANAHYAILMEQGISPDSVIVENRSTNTLENVTFALPLIQNLTAITSILVIAKWMHSRRVLMTLKQQIPQPMRYYAYTYEPAGVTRENWHLNPQKESANVLKNWNGIPKYLEWGHIAEVTREGDYYV